MTELAWAAGFFDGEGCTSLQKGKYLRLNISQNHSEVLHRFQEAVGVGNVSYTVNRGKPFYQYFASSKAAIIALSLLWPYLGNVKKAQALTKLEVLKGV